MKFSTKLMTSAVMLAAAQLAVANDWTVYGGDTGNTRYSTASQISPANVKNLQVKFAVQLGTNRSQESVPIVVGDTMYVTSSYGPKNVIAVNAKTGVMKWRYQPEMPKNVDQFAAFAEFVGSFLFMYFGGACVANSADHGLGVAALGNGFAYSALIFGTSAISGGHLNPAISSAFLLTGRISKVNFLAYVFAQVLGAIFGALFLHWCLPTAAHAFVTTGVMVQQNVFTALLWEFIMTFTLVFVVFAVAFNKDLKSSAPIAIGLTIIVATFAGGPFTGASLNPARSIAPAFVFGHWSQLWMYLFATIAGGCCGGYVYEHLFISQEEEEVESSANGYKSIVDTPSA